MGPFVAPFTPAKNSHILASSVLTDNGGRRTYVALHATKGRRNQYLGLAA